MKISRTKDYVLVSKLNKNVQDLHTHLFPEIFKDYHDVEVQNFFKETMNKPNMVFLLLEDYEEPVGYAWIEYRDYPENAFKKPYTSAYVHQISISENYKNKGYGSKLMDEICAIAKTNGMNKIELDYWVENEAAKEFYKKREFIPIREVVYKEIY